ncbi:MAG: peptide chain release factor N(5)-glutamine methyltransferase [Bacteroidaceae bacterium]|nr:peptide chain release factor N(5)-glutamine methyltransferase [Bacteroidaceae bacterium]
MQTLLRSLTQTLASCYSREEASSVARIVLSEGMGFSTVRIYSGKDNDLSDIEQKKLQKIVSRLLNFEPLQYVLGKASFCNLSLKVAPGVLIPRPETEELVTLIAKECAGSEPRLLDIGTGSGCIAIALKKIISDACVEAWDISAEALSQAKKNASFVGVDISFRQIDILQLQPIKDIVEEYDILVSNPPYVLYSEQKEMDPQVLNWEPHSALFVPDEDALRFYRSIATLGRRLLREGGFLYFEINKQFGADIMMLLKSLGYKHVQLIKDQFLNDRIIKAER